jgi:hypothetical protein
VKQSSTSNAELHWTPIHRLDLKVPRPTAPGRVQRSRLPCLRDSALLDRAFNRQCPSVTPSSPLSTIVLVSPTRRLRKPIFLLSTLLTNPPAHCEYATPLIDIPHRTSPSPTIRMADNTDANAGPPHNPVGIVDEAGNEAGDLHCCCGKEECVFLRHNCSVLSSVERDVHAAARMGQVSYPPHFFVSLSPCFLTTPAPAPAPARILCGCPP